MEVTWTGSKQYSPWRFEAITCTASRDWLSREHFEDHASGVYSWLLRTETVAGVRVVCEPTDGADESRERF